MSAYAILGATGQVGGSILHILGENLDNKINVLVRSRSKLEHCYPSVVSNKNIRVFEGPVSDTQTLAACVRDARVVFLCVAVKGNAPGLSIYDDLARAETYMRQHEDWLDMTFVMPGGLSHDVRQGHELSAERQRTFISFLDLAAGMIEIADADTRCEGNHISVVLKEGRKARIEWWAPVVLSKGLLCYVFPWLYAWLP